MRLLLNMPPLQLMQLSAPMAHNKRKADAKELADGVGDTSG
jgi:hypothetical protein